MRTVFVIVSSMVLCLVAAVPMRAQDKPAGKPLSGAELKALFGTGQGVMLDGELHAIPVLVNNIVLPDGRAFLQELKPYNSFLRSTATWRIQGDTICYTWSHSPLERCRLFYLIGRDKYENRDINGKLISSGRIRRLSEVLERRQRQ